MKKISKWLKFVFIPMVILLFMLVILFPSLLERVDFSDYQNQRVLEHIAYLSSPALKGRLTGDDSNQAAIDYVREAFKSYGLKPISAELGYDQPFETIVPTIQEDATLEVHMNNGEVKTYKQYTDYRMYTSGNAGSAHFEGEIVYVGQYLFKVAKEEIQGRVVMLAVNEFSEDMRTFLIENEAAGALVSYSSSFSISNPEHQLMKSASFFGKKGDTMPIAVISKQMSIDFRVDAALKTFEIEATHERNSVFGTIPKLVWDCDIKFPTRSSANILGVLPGKTDEILIVSAHLDHVGEEVEGGYFPGALDNASGVAMVLELARLSSQQMVKPEKTLVFVAWNGEELGLMGSAYYVENPVFPLEKTEVINIDMIGGYKDKKLIVSALNDIDQIAASRYIQYAEALGFETDSVQMGGSDHASFSGVDVPAVLFSQGYENYHRVTDTIDNIDPVTLGHNGSFFTTVFEKEVFGELNFDFLTANERLFFALYLFGLLILYSVDTFQNHAQTQVRFKNAVEWIYYSPFYQLLKRIYSFLTPVLLLMLFLGVLTQLPKDLNWVKLDHQQVSNFSPYLTIKKTVLYYRNLFGVGFGKTFRGSSAFDIIGKAFKNSGKLLFFALVIAIPLGIIKGFFDVYGGKAKRGLRTFGSIVLLSIPDLMWILISFFVIVYIGKMDLEAKWLQGAYLRGWIMPLITLSILPIVYISRISMVAAEEELGKPYIRALRAKGLSKRRIYSRHLTKPVLIKVFDSLASLTTIMISNLILIEYLFDYKGIVNNVLIYSLNDDTNTFIGLVLSLGLLFVICLLIFKGFSFIMNPRKQEVKS